jgi:hypothetical protein
LSGYTRQSSADIVPTAVVRATPINNEFNALRDAFNETTGHKHDGTAAEGVPIPVIADTDLKNKVAIDSTNNRVGIFVEVSSAAAEQVRVQDGAIVPVVDNDIDLGTSSLEFKDLYIDGTANIDSLLADAAVITSADVNGGTIDATVIGASSAQAITGTLITATTGFSGPITGAVTGNVTGNLTGNVTGNVTGNLTGNVTATTGSSSFNDVTITGTLNMDSGTVGTITNLASPTNSGDAATKGYVDTADALKLNLSGGTMSGAIAMGNNKITGLGTPTANTDAATKVYVDTAVANVIDSAPGALDTLNELAAALNDDASFSTTVTNSIATKLALAGGTMSGAIAMGTNKITGLGTPTSTADAATKGYVDTADALKLNLSGGTMSGAIAMGTNKITGLGDPTSSQDAATKTYVDTADALKLNLSGGTMSGAIAMGTNKITGLGDPTSAQDAATKNYIDVLYGSTASAATSAAAAAVSATNALNSANSASSSASTATTAANNAAASYDSFDDRYLGAKGSVPTLDNDGNALITGALYFNSVSNTMFVYTGTAWVAAGSAVNGTSQRSVYTATASQTTFAIVYDVGFVDVYQNGAKLVSGVDFTATNGTSVILTTGATAGDSIDIVAYGAFLLANTYTQAAADAKFAQVANNLSDLTNTATARTNLGLAIGTNVQAYDADTAKYDDVTANFTGTLQNGGSNVVVDSDIGSTVQAYDVNTAKYNATTANFTGTLQNGGSNVVVDSDIGVTVQAYDSNLTSFVSTFTLPTTDGTANQLLQTNGSGTLSFVPAPAGGAQAFVTMFNGGNTAPGMVSEGFGLI